MIVQVCCDSVRRHFLISSSLGEEGILLCLGSSGRGPCEILHLRSFQAPATCSQVFSSLICISCTDNGATASLRQNEVQSNLRHGFPSTICNLLQKAKKILCAFVSQKISKQE